MRAAQKGESSADTFNPSTMKRIITTLSTLAVATSVSLAQPQPEDFFHKLDTNGDGALSLEEFKAGPAGQKNPAMAEEYFNKLDKNGDGKVTLEELTAHRAP